MFLRSIRLINFRNYKDTAFSFKPQGAVIIGANGSGKTNLLEAIAYSGTGKSVRFHQDEQLLRHESAFFSVKADYTNQKSLSNSISLSYFQNKKMLKLNNMPIRQLSYLYQTVKVTYLSPDDIIIINGSPRFRRQFFDLAIAQLFPEYIAQYRNYLHILQQRNALLKKDHSANELEQWDNQYISSMITILSFRDRYLKMLNDELAQHKSKLTVIIGDLSIIAQPNGYKWMEEKPDPQLLKDFLRQIMPREKLFQRSMLGAHLDDYAIRLEGRSMKCFGSQGQKRIALIAIKMAHSRLIEKVTGIKPIMLFDDILAELDDQNVYLVKDLIDCSYQTFIASPNEGSVHIWKNLPIICLTKK